MTRLRKLPDNGLKPISKEALARCVEVGTNDRNLAALVRADKSFDVAIVSSEIISEMEVELFKYKGVIPMYDTYCGHAVEKAMNQLPYAIHYEYSSCVRIK